MTYTSTKTPAQLVKVLSDLLDTTNSLTPEIVRDLESLVVWCENAVDDLDDQNVEIGALQEQVETLQGINEDLKSELRRVKSEMLDAADGENSSCKQALVQYAVELNRLL